MRIYGPTDAYSSTHWYALTEPTFDWQHEGPCTDQGCTAGQVLIDLTIRYTYPRWVSADNADAGLRDQWTVFSSALVFHEEGHGTLAIGCAWRIGEAFAVLPPAASYADFEWSMYVASEAIFAECRNEQRSYENSTDHGRSQGVIWGY